MLSDKAEGRELRTGDGRRIILGALIKSGGAGSVYRVREQADVVAKLYHGNVDHALYERKVTAMLQLTPELPDLFESGRRYVQIAWPRALLRDPKGHFVGYLMPAVDVKATSELECVLQEKQARKLKLPTGLGAKITLAANLAGVLAELHRQQHRLVDLKPVNLRFYPSSLYMAVLDCDGFSIQGGGERFEAPQYTAEYLAPEFQPGGLSAAGEEAQDRFALAVVVFQLLNFGLHPYAGRPTHEAVPTDIAGRIAARLYAYGQRGNPRLLPSPVSGHGSMPADLRALFDRAFEGAGNARPSALEWGSALRGYAQRSSLRLTNCTREREHQHFAGLPCAACARSALLVKTAKTARPPPPPPQLAPGVPRVRRAPTGARAPGRGGFPWHRPGAPNPAPAPPATPNWPPATILPGTRGAPRWPVNPPPIRSTHVPHRGRSSSAPGGCLWVVGAAIVSLAIFLTILGPAKEPAARRPAPDVRPLGPRAPISEAPVLQPIAVHEEAGAPAMTPSWSEIDETRTQALWVALGTADDNRVMVENAMRQLRSSGARNRLPDTDTQRLDVDGRFRGFAVVAPTLGEDERIQLMRELAAHLTAEPYDAESACEWSWLALLDGRREFARDGFLRAIWADPQRACGWLGLGTLTQENRASYGALVMAETLQSDGSVDFQARDHLVESALYPDVDEVERWRILDARARVRTAQLRQHKDLPAAVSELARKSVPERAR